MATVFAAGRYLSWGVISISATNLAIIATMVAVFVLALVVPFPQDRGAQQGELPAQSRGEGGES